MTIAIVGGGLAGLRSAEDLRHRGHTGRIVLFSDEDAMPYNRPPLSKEFLWGDATAEELSFGLSERAADVEWRLGCRVAAADLDAKTLTLDGGETVGYDGLVAATGVSSRRLTIPGPQEGRVVLRSLADAMRLQSRMTPGTRLVILGAGFIGCEVARTAVRRGCSVDVVAIDPAPMVVPLGREVGDEIRRRHEAAGIRFHLGHSVVRTVGDARIEEVVLDDGARLPADLLLETVGSIPNTAWLEGNGLDLANGVLTDAFLRAGGRPGIVVVGDIARFANPLLDTPPLRIEHWQTAIDTAVFASKTLLHDLGELPEPPDPVSIMPWFWSDQGDLRLTSYGTLAVADATEILEGDLGGECAVAYLRDGEPVGVLLIGMKQKAARHKRWLQKARNHR
jgi:3-phenylpropionate/trans-cinnamate dioxygenase ferredoxin reductase component